MVHVELLFGPAVSDPLQPLRDEVATGKLGPFDVDKVLVVDPSMYLKKIYSLLHVSKKKICMFAYHVCNIT